MRSEIHFRRNGQTVRTPGIDYGPKPIEIIEEYGRRMLWKVPGHKVWAGNFGTPWKWWGTLYIAVEVEENEATVIFEEQPGRTWRETESRLRAWVAGGGL